MQEIRQPLVTTTCEVGRMDQACVGQGPGRVHDDGNLQSPAPLRSAAHNVGHILRIGCSKLGEIVDLSGAVTPPRHDRAHTGRRATVTSLDREHRVEQSSLDLPWPATWPRRKVLTDPAVNARQQPINLDYSCG